MDEKLYYVESPDGQILGPMNLIHIIEGIAEGVILESARICEVGAQEWVPLSSVTYTRSDDDEPVVEEHVPSVSMTEPIAEEPVDEVPTFEVPDPIEHESLVEEPFAHLETEPETEPETDLPAEEELQILSADQHWAPAAEETPEAAPVEEKVHEWDEPIGQELAPEELTPTEPASEPVPMASAETDPVEPTLVDEPAALEGAAAFQEPESEFDLPEDDPFENEEERPEEWAAAEADEPGSRRPKWLIAAAVLAVPAVIAVYMLVGSEPSGAPKTANAPSAVADPASPFDRAQNLLTSGRAKEALIGFEEILAEEPDNARAHRGLGRAALQSGDPELAIEHLEKAVALETDKPFWLTDLSRALHETGRTESAIQKLGTYLENRSDDAEWQRTRLDWMLSSGKQADAAVTYGALAKKSPESAFHQHLAGLALENDAQAETYLRRSIELDPTNGDVHVALARVLAVRGKTNAAAASLRRAIEHRPASPEEEALLASLEKAAPAAAKPKTAVAAAPKSTPKAETPAAKPTPKAAPPEAKPQPTQVATTKTVEPKPEPAKPAPVKPAPAKLATRTAQVRQALAEERFDAAREVLAKARRELGNTAEVRRNVDLWEGIVAFEEERFSDALAQFQALDPDASYAAGGWGAGAVPNWIARVHLATGDVRNAVGALDGVGPADPDEYAVARLWEGVALASLGMSEMASRTWERIPTDVGARVDKPGRAAMKSAELLLGAISEKAYRTEVDALTGFENDMHFFLAYAAQRKQDAERAAEHFEKAVELSAGREFPYHLARAQVSGTGILQQ